MCTALVVGNMIGTGVFLLPASLAPLGWNAIIGWILTIAGGLCLAFVFAALSYRYPKAGGPYAYTLEAFGPAVAFIVAWSYWISMWVGNAAIATGAISYLSVFFPSIAEVTGVHAVVTLSAIWLLIVINMRGTVIAGGVQLITTILKILPLIFVVGIGMFVVMRNGPSAVAPLEVDKLEISGITAAATLTLWGLLGLESATVPAGNVKDPEKTIPRATMLGMVIAGIIYLLVFSSILLLMPPETIANSNAPFAVFIGTFMNTSMGWVIALFAVISGLGALNGWILLMGELPNAMAKSGVFPKWMSKRSDRDTPVRALLVSGILLTVVVVMNYQKTMTELFTFIVLLSTAAALFMFLACALAALKLQWQGKLKAPRIMLVIGVLAAIYAVWTISGAGGEAVMWGLVLLLAGLPVYALMRRSKP